MGPAVLAGLNRGPGPKPGALNLEVLLVNMSYCRFENTARDLADCERALEGLLVADESQLSDSELAAAKNLVEACQRIAESVADRAGVAIEDLNGRHIGVVLDTANAEAPAER